MTDLTSLWHYSRPKLAASLCARLVAGERVAMFGARQTGKTTLLREEVMPAAVHCGALPIYIECWADKGKPLVNLPNLLPASMIVEGGVIAFESNVRTGGKGASYLALIRAHNTEWTR